MFQAAIKVASNQVASYIEKWKEYITQLIDDSLGDFDERFGAVRIQIMKLQEQVAKYSAVSINRVTY